MRDELTGDWEPFAQEVYRASGWALTHGQFAELQALNDELRQFQLESEPGGWVLLIAAGPVDAAVTPLRVLAQPPMASCDAHALLRVHASLVLAEQQIVVDLTDTPVDDVLVRHGDGRAHFADLRGLPQAARNEACSCASGQKAKRCEHLQQRPAYVHVTVPAGFNDADWIKTQQELPMIANPLAGPVPAEHIRMADVVCTFGGLVLMTVTLDLPMRAITPQAAPALVARHADEVIDAHVSFLADARCLHLMYGSGPGGGGSPPPSPPLG